jgi:hypothetical protein
MGLSGLGAALQAMAKAGVTMKSDRIHKVLGEGNILPRDQRRAVAGKPTSFYDVWRVENGKIAQTGTSSRPSRRATSGRTPTASSDRMNAVLPLENYRGVIALDEPFVRCAAAPAERMPALAPTWSLEETIRGRSAHASRARTAWTPRR